MPLPSTDELFDAVLWQYGRAPLAAADPAVTELSTLMDSAGYGAMVASAVARMRTPGPPCTRSCSPARSPSA